MGRWVFEGVEFATRGEMCVARRCRYVEYLKAGMNFTQAARMVGVSKRSGKVWRRGAAFGSVRTISGDPGREGVGSQCQRVRQAGESHHRQSRRTWHQLADLLMLLVSGREIPC